MWHSQILEHEDNEMMRPYIVIQASGVAIPQELIIAIVVLIVIITLVFIGLKIYQSRSQKK